MAKKIDTMQEDTRYYDTWRLLKKYRDVVWSIENFIALRKEIDRVLTEN